MTEETRGGVGERELVVIVRQGTSLRMRGGAPEAAAASAGSELVTRLAKEGASLRPLFGSSPERLAFEVATLRIAPDLTGFFRVDADDARLDELAEALRTEDAVEAAYVKPPSELPVLNDMVPQPEDAPPVTPDFNARQLYLDAPPGGINARAVWALPGASGAGVRIIDIEGAWRFTHEDLLQNQGGVIGGTQSTEAAWRNHGTAVVGEFGGDRNAFGTTGICPDANVRAIAIFGGLGSAAAIRQAANALSPGDIILIELHRAGPRFNFQGRNDQLGYIAVEWWPDDFAAIQYATSRGVIVVEAAGNGAEDLDDAIYSVRPAGFPAAWSNPFNRANPNSGAILVGAGAPPPGTHGANHGADRSRLSFSNWGAAIDAQGWGREVTTTGYGDLQGGPDENIWYTDRFSGTSSASPIVVGALASTQGVLRARGQTLMTPARARQCLRATGSVQQDEPGRPATQRIGNRPDIQALIRCASPKPKEVKEGKEIKERKENKEWKEKEWKEKERKEVWKEFKEKEHGEKDLRKDVKEKDFKDMKEVREKAIDSGPLRAEGFEDRLTRIEQSVGALSHFIEATLRPDLLGATLAGPGNDPCGNEAEEAKGQKDSKDLEKGMDR